MIDTGKTVRISKIFNCSLDYLLKDEVEQMDINIAAASEEAKENKIRAGILTYLSFPPIFGLIVGIISLKFQSEEQSANRSDNFRDAILLNSYRVNGCRIFVRIIEY